ncbi:hypothetical protein PS723_03243 [Pseudomonas fluorescens]|uniref:Uncharacterized protein n=1 Tax=Pseudomonas fluorescens TaxID=294 RepID=A0A5E7DAF3_PSEFL|nr:hypothetical protein PS723_03243 [Pseudomonas fluorescens]
MGLGQRNLKNLSEISVFLREFDRSEIQDMPLYGVQDTTHKECARLNQ